MDEDFETRSLPAEPMTKFDVLFAATGFVHDVLQAAADAVETVHCAVAMHVNYVSEQKRFEREAGLAIERIARGEFE